MQLPEFFRRFGRALLIFIALDVVGVGLTLLVDLVAFVDRVWETSALLGYVIWFVVGVFAGAFNYPLEDPESEAGRRSGVVALAATAAAALVLGAVAAFFWSSSEGTEPVVPDHFGVTITYLVTAVLAVAAARFVLLRPAPADAAAMRAGEASSRRIPRFDDEEALQRALAPRDESTVRTERTNEPFRPAGIGGTLAFLLGVPVLLSFDVSFFVLGPFDVFDRWAPPLLTGSLVAGVAWGAAAARLERPREWLLMAHAPLLIGTVFYLFGLLPGAVLAMFGAPAWLAENTPFAGFLLGFLLGLVALGGAFTDRVAEHLRARFQRANARTKNAPEGADGVARKAHRAARTAARQAGRAERKAAPAPRP